MALIHNLNELEIPRAKLTGPDEAGRRRGRGLRAPFIISLVVLGGLVLVSVFASEIAPYGYARSFNVPLGAPSLRHIFGTDNIGEDVFSRVIFGGRITFEVAFPAIFGSMIVGTTIALIAVYYRGIVDTILMGLIDVLFAFPAILLAITFVAVLGPSLKNLIIVIGIIYVPGFAVIVRSSALAIRERNFVEASMLMGSSGYRVIVRHILPNVVPVLFIQTALALSSAVLTEAALSFLGLGAPPPAPSWGAMLGSAQSTMTIAPWTVIFPGIAIVLTVISLNLIADGLEARYSAEDV